MQQAFGISVPDTVAEMCRPDAAAVLVYDAQAGIFPHVQDQAAVISRMKVVLAAARAAGVPVLYTRHVSLPTAQLGVAALRAAMAWQRVNSPTAVQQAFPPDAPQTALLDELAPVAGEPVFDKLGMSALVGTPVATVLRDRRLTTLVLVGAVLEIGIEPTARHAADLGFLPVVVTDACGVVEPAAGQRALESLDYTLMCYRCTSDEVAGAFRGDPVSAANGS